MVGHQGFQNQFLLMFRHPEKLDGVGTIDNRPSTTCFTTLNKKEITIKKVHVKCHVHMTWDT